jgi:hypothetical protein
VLVTQPLTDPLFSSCILTVGFSLSFSLPPRPQTPFPPWVSQPAHFHWPREQTCFRIDDFFPRPFPSACLVYPHARTHARVHTCMHDHGCGCPSPPFPPLKPVLGSAWFSSLFISHHYSYTIRIHARIPRPISFWPFLHTGPHFFPRFELPVWVPGASASLGAANTRWHAGPFSRRRRQRRCSPCSD